MGTSGQEGQWGAGITGAALTQQDLGAKDVVRNLPLSLVRVQSGPAGIQAGCLAEPTPQRH